MKWKKWWILLFEETESIQISYTGGKSNTSFQTLFAFLLLLTYF